ncbi:endonuclease I family protein [Niallia sp. Krafla_26]|uniref:endonuclease I family protein n=1 Tax=Niallia sp. Krafla_26 TaxID=3064703 RepID=UPI003D173B0C
MNSESINTLLLDRIGEIEASLGHDFSLSLVELDTIRKQILSNLQFYYSKSKDDQDVQDYYHSVRSVDDGQHLFYEYHSLLKKTHQPIPYFLSKDQYLYSWVDLQPDGTIKSIYSGIKRDPKTLMKEDLVTIKKKYAEFQMAIEKQNQSKNIKDIQIRKIDHDFKFNTEHMVPQSWYGTAEPMKGDLHHLFACDPECNIKRSNSPYGDFSFYHPESLEEKIKNHCGVSLDGKFEPEYGKGTIARDMLYFLIRYPHTIKKSFVKQINVHLLLHWHEQFNVTIYEKHRNQAIYQIQGNRNPFIDFPELAQKVNFQLGTSKKMTELGAG